MNNISIRALSIALLSLLMGPLYGADPKEGVTFFNKYSTMAKAIVNSIKEVAPGPGSKVTARQFGYSDRGFRDPLIEAHDRGVPVKIGISHQLRHYGEDEQKKLEDDGMDVHYIDTHEKTWVIEESTGERTAYTGSPNATFQAHFNYESGVQIHDASAVKEITNIWDNRDKGVEPVQELPPAKSKEKPWNTPKKGAVGVLASEVRSPSSVFRDVLGRLKPTPPKKKGESADQRTVSVALMNINDDPEGTRKRKCLLEALTEEAQKHLNTQYTIVIDEQCAKRVKHQDRLTTLAEQENVDLRRFEPPAEKTNRKTRRILHNKQISVNDGEDSILAISTGNATVQGAKEPNMSFVARISAATATHIEESVENIPSVPFEPIKPVSKKKPASKKSTSKKDGSISKKAKKATASSKSSSKAKAKAAK